MNNVRLTSKILGIAALTAFLTLPAQSAMANFSWSIGYSHHDKHHHRRSHYHKKHHHKKHHRHAHYRPYKHKKYHGHKHHKYHRNHKWHRRHHYDHFGRRWRRPHYKHHSGILVSLPHGGRYKYHHGKRYYFHSGVYYAKSDCGTYWYPAPVEIHKHYHSSPKPKVTHIYESDLDSSADASEFVINIKNSEGEYTKIKIKKHYHGYMGPQGEYYDSFPEVAQLKAMYVR